MKGLGISGEDFSNLEPAEREEAARLTTEVMQWHHDLHIALERSGRIKPEQLEDLALAQLREEEGQVNPLADGAETAVLERYDSIQDESVE